MRTWIVFCGVCVLSTGSAQAGSFYESMISLHDQPLQTNMSEDLEPVLRDFASRYRKEAIKFGQNFIYDDKLDPNCLQSYARIMSGVQNFQPWAMRFFDSSGILTPNIAEGRLIAHGSYDECLDIRVPDKEEPEKVAFNGQYCTVVYSMKGQPLVRRAAQIIVDSDKYLKHYIGENITWLQNFLDRVPIGHRLGICLPSTCSPDIIPYFIHKFAGKYGVQAAVLGCRDPLNEKPTLPGTRVAAVVVCILICIVFLTTCIEFWVPLNNKEAVKLVQCFSARAMTNRLLGTEPHPENRHIDCVHGIRVLSALWVVFAHTYATDPGNLDRPYHMFKKLQEPFFMLVLQSILAVDTFYTLTGILLYQTLKTERQRFKSISAVPFAVLVIVRRAVRLLVPLFGAVCMLYLLPLFVTGPSMDYLYEHFTDACSKNWWRLAFFVSNLWDFDDACLIHAWYISADLQMICVLILPVLLLISWPQRGIQLITCLGVASVFYAGAVLIIHDTTPSVLLLPMRVAQVFRFSMYQHTSSLAHLSVMCVGAIGGYLINNYRDTQIRRVFFVVGWLLCVVMLAMITFVPLKWSVVGNYGQIDAITYVMLSRPFWAMSIVWIVFACAAGYGKPIRILFNRSNVVVLSRLSYSFFLVANILVLVKMFAARTASPFTHYHQIREFIADTIFGFMLAYVGFLLFDGPTYALDKWVMSLCNGNSANRSNGSGSAVRESGQKAKSCTIDCKHDVKNTVWQGIKL